MANYTQQSKKKVKRPKYRISFIFFTSVLTFAICFAIYMKDDTIDISPEGLNTTKSSVTETPQDSSVIPTDTTAQTTDASSISEPIVPSTGNPIALSESVGMEYFDNCVFVGDSLTLGLSSYNIFSTDNVFASIGMNIDKIDTSTITTRFGDVTVLNALIKTNPQIIYIMLGSNGIFWMSNNSMIEKYSQFIDDIKEKLPNAKIYALSIPPVTAEKETILENPVLNSSIDSYNSELLTLANTKNINFVDLNTALKNNDGKLDTDKAERDGYHFKRATYDIMLDYLMTHVAK